MKARYWVGLGALSALAGTWIRKQRARPRRYRLDFEAGPEASEPGSIYFIGTATTLIRFGGMTILTDPNFLHRGEHIHVGYGIHSHRLTDPAISFEELPPIDFVLLSHLHEDHFDRLVEQRLRKDIPIVTTPQASRALRRRGFTNTIPLRRWDSVRAGKGLTRLRLTSMPGTHGPLLVASLLPQVMGSMLEFRDGRDDSSMRMYISGDTLVFRDLWEIPRRYPRVDLALLHLGGTRIMGILLTMDAQQGIEAMKIVGADVNIPIHYDDYDVFKDPLKNFVREVEAAGLQGKVQYLRRGDTYTFPGRKALPPAQVPEELVGSET